jgi:hypothetical protein
MRKTFETIATLIITFVISIFLNTTLNYLSKYKGSVLIQRPLDLDGNTYIPIIFSNFTDDFKSDVVFAFPCKIDPSKIRSTSPLSVTARQSDTSTAESLLVFGGFPPNSTASLYVPVSAISGTNFNEIMLKNPNAGKIKILNNSDIYDPARQAMLTALFDSCVYAVMFTLVLMYMRIKHDERKKHLDQQIEKSEERSNQATSELNDLKGEVKRSSDKISKFRLLFLARIDDYRKELDFYRKTIAHLLIREKSDKKVIDEITDHLKTYGTKDFSKRDLESILALSTYLSDKEK